MFTRSRVRNREPQLRKTWGFISFLFLFFALSTLGTLTLLIHYSLLYFYLLVWSIGKEWCHIWRPTQLCFATKPSYSHICACCRLLKELWPSTDSRLFIRRMAVFDEVVIHFHLLEKGMWTSVLQSRSAWEMGGISGPSVHYIVTSGERSQ